MQKLRQMLVQFCGVLAFLHILLGRYIVYGHIHGANNLYKTYLFDIGRLNILQDSHKYLVQYMFHFHRQGHIWLDLYGHTHGANGTGTYS